MAVFAIIIISSAFEGYVYFLGNINNIFRILFFITGILILMPNLISIYFGFSLLMVLLFILGMMKLYKRKNYI